MSKNELKRQKKKKKGEYPGDLDEATFWGVTEVGVRKRAEEEENGGFGGGVARVPEDESEDERGEEEEEEKESRVADDDEEENGERKADEEEGNQNVEGQRRNGLAAASVLLYQNSIGEVVHQCLSLTSLFLSRSL